MVTADKNIETFWDHLDELRGVLIRIIVAVFLAAFTVFFFKDQLFSVVLAPKYENFITYQLINKLAVLIDIAGIDPFSIQLINTVLAEQFIIHMQMALYVGILLVSPYILYQLFHFVTPALYLTERRYAFQFVGSGYIMFLLGILFNYFLIFPLTFRFLGSYQVAGDINNLITLQSYIDTMMMMCIMMGIVFEVPILCWLFGKIGILKSAFMSRYRKHAVFIILLVAAIITPTSDIFTLLLVAFPIWLLYEISIRIVKRTEIIGSQLL